MFLWFVQKLRFSIEQVIIQSVNGSLDQCVIILIDDSVVI